jgi:hypothetical protein
LQNGNNQNQTAGDDGRCPESVMIFHFSDFFHIFAAISFKTVTDN